MFECDCRQGYDLSDNGYTCVGKLDNSGIKLVLRLYELGPHLLLSNCQSLRTPETGAKYYKHSTLVIYDSRVCSQYDSSHKLQLFVRLTTDKCDQIGRFFKSSC